MIGEYCITLAEKATLQQAIFNSHVQWGAVCLLIGYGIAYGIYHFEDIYGWINEKRNG